MVTTMLSGWRRAREETIGKNGREGPPANTEAPWKSFVDTSSFISMLARLGNGRSFLNPLISHVSFSKSWRILNRCVGQYRNLKNLQSREFERTYREINMRVKLGNKTKKKKRNFKLLPVIVIFLLKCIHGGTSGLFKIK